MQKGFPAYIKNIVITNAATKTHTGGIIYVKLRVVYFVSEI